MALKFSGLAVLFVFLCHGYLPVSAVDQAPNMIHPPLFNYGTQYGDKRVKNMGKPEIVALQKNITYFGSNYRELYISPHGTVGFGVEGRYIESIKFSEGLRNPSTDTPFIAPFYFKAYETLDMDPTKYIGSIFYRSIFLEDLTSADPHYSEHRRLLNYFDSYLHQAVVDAPGNFEAKFVLLVTWDQVMDDKTARSNRDCTESQDCEETATFQAVIVTDLGKHTYAIFNYLKMEVPIQEFYQAGCNGGDGRGWFNVIPCHGDCEYRMNVSSTLEELPGLQGSDVVGRFILSVGGEMIVRGGCLPKDIYAGMMEVYPKTVTMFGGEKLQVSGQCLTATTKIYCRFGNAAEKHDITEGAMINSMKGYCPVPLMSRIGEVYIYMSDDRSEWTADNVMTVVFPGRVGDPVVVQEPVKDQWYRRDSPQITVPWSSKLFTNDGSARVEIKLIGYRETTREVEYQVLENFGTIENRHEQYTFDVADHRCHEDCEKYEIGLLEVGLPPEYYGSAKDRVAVRFGPIPLGWYVNEALKDDRGNDWSDQKCREWHDADAADQSWLDDLLPCPCSLDQALADFGRWQTDPGCDLFDRSVCHYHKGAKHCVRSVTPTFKDGSGNQCCYNKDGTLRYSQLSFQGSTPDRSHTWGAAPYMMPNRVPEFSHWKHDVVTFYYCCLWNNYDLCELYMEQRPTQDCKNYDVPGLAFIRGDPHITTYDGQNYYFGGGGDFWLATDNAPGYPLLIQGRFEPRSNSWDLGALTGKGSWMPKALTALALRGGDSTDIEITLAPRSVRQRGLEIRIDRSRVFFQDPAAMWQDFRGFAIFNNGPRDSSNRHDNITILLTRIKVGVNVVATNNLLHVTVSVPPNMKPEEGKNAKVVGLLGTYDQQKDNDYTTKEGTLISPGLDKEKIFENFAHTWFVADNEPSLFTFSKKAEDPDPEHAYYEFLDIPVNFNEAPPQSTVKHFCGGNKNCEFDYQITGDSSVGQATKDADVNFNYIQSSAYRVQNCGLPEVGRMASMSNYNFSVKQKMTVTGCDTGYSFAGEEEYECVKETLDKAKEQDRDDYGDKWTDTSDGKVYLIHWTPEPRILCSPEVAESADTGLIIGIVVGVLAGIVVLGLIIFFIVKKRKSGKSNMKERPKPAKREMHSDPAAAQAMLASVEDRSPVYRPSKEPVRMSELSGSNV